MPEYYEAQDRLKREEENRRERYSYSNRPLKLVSEDLEKQIVSDLLENKI